MSGNKVILRLAEQDVDELRRILVAAEQQTIRALSDLTGCGYLPAGIDLCRRKSRMQHLLRCLDGLEGPRLVPVANSSIQSLSAAA